VSEPRRGASKREHGEHRPVYAAILHDDAFHGVSVLAKWIWTELKLRLGPAGIGQVRAGVLAESTHTTDEVVLSALSELEAIGWIRRDGNTAWLVAWGLHAEPALTAANPRHRKLVANALKALGESELITAYREEYADWLTLDDTVQRTVPNTVHDTDKNHGTGAVTGAVTPSESIPSVSDNPSAADLPEAAGIFLKEFYSDATLTRQADVLKQLRAALTPGGAQIKGSDRARAVDELHFSRSLAKIIRVRRPSDPNVAIQWALKEIAASRLEYLSEQLAQPEREREGGMSQVSEVLAAAGAVQT
jgi:hypothetical protein